MASVNLTTDTAHPKMDLYELNMYEALRRLPVVLFIGVLAFAGIIGNLHVLYIYCTFFKPSTYRVFVLLLSIIDLLCCLVSMPFEMIDEIFPFSYSEIISCKIFRFINTAIAVASAFTLVLIASERYRRICRPYDTQMSETTAIYSSLGVVVAALVFTFPALYVYGRKTLPDLPVPGYNVSVYNVTGFECTWGDHMEGSVFGYIYYTWVLMSVVGPMIALGVLYSIIGVNLKKHNDFMRVTLRSKNKSEANPSQSLTCVSDTEQQNRISTNDRNVENANSSVGSKEFLLTEANMRHVTTEVKNGSSKPGSNLAVPQSSLDNISGRRISDRKSSNESSNSAQTNRSSQNPLRPKETTISDKEQRITKVLFAITMLFICSFLPYIIIMIAFFSDSSYSDGLNTTELVLYLISFRLYMINSVANSLFYGFFDTKFRKHVKRLYQLFYDCCKSRVGAKKV
ncbi:cholecystokinin receptor type A-like [Ylistrum balloti]|uniref:cholecystokinin receptor type A-like n=1 Tax=Ylistrum balloti TaxID=509963 RepID=UPI0029058364|nr:cholecystokinin receptor type A-like [Ylistrum balloti]